MTSRGPQPGLGFFGAGTTSPGGRSPDVSALQAQVNSLVAKVNGAIDRIDVAGKQITFTSVDGQTHQEALPSVADDFKLTADKITSAINNGEAPNSGTLAGLSSGWWYVPDEVSAPLLKGRPTGMTGEGVLYKQIVSEQGGANRGVMLAYGQNAKLEDTMWVRFKTSSSWGSWIEYPNATNMLSDMQTLITNVQSQQAQDKASLNHLNQVVAGLVGDVTKDKKDIAALKLEHIPTMDEIEKHLTDEGWGALTAHLTVDQVKQALSSAGWGPTPTQISVQDVKAALEKAGWGPLPTKPQGGGGDHPVVQLPKVWMMFHSSIPTDLSSATTTTNGEATLRKASGDNQRLWIIVEKDVAAKVTGIKVGSSLAAKWDTRDLTINGHTYTGFYSAGGFTTFSKKVTVEFGG